MKFSVKLSLAVLIAYFAAAIYGEVQYRVSQIKDVTPVYNVVDMSSRDLPPSPEHWLGTDNLGRSVALRLIQGTRIAFLVGVFTSLIAIPLGVILGLAGGYFGGKTDSFVVWLCATVSSMPSLLFILAIASSAV
jgi:ABC-type dipeptide/oligopeptide/nickel transport system permease subunit